MSDFLVRMGGARAVLAYLAKVLVALALIAALPLIYTWPFSGSHHPMVTIVDEMDVFDDAATVKMLEGVSFRRDVNLVALSLDVEYNGNFNRAVLDFAREGHPEWISSANSNYWEDGLLILGVSPTGRWVGTYFGEDIKVSLDQQAKIQDAGKSSMRQANWAHGMLDMAKASASLIGHPIPSAFGRILVGLPCALIGVGIIAFLRWNRNRGKRHFAAARRHYGQVTQDYEETQVLAETIPADNRHGAQVLARWRWFEDQYASLTREVNEFGTPRGVQWTHTSVAKRSVELKSRAEELDSLDDVVAAAASFLTLGVKWREHWMNEQGPIRENLDSFAMLLNQIEKVIRGYNTNWDREWLRGAKGHLDQMTSDLEAGTITPVQALDTLASLSDTVTKRAEAAASNAIAADRSAYANERRERFNKDRNKWQRGTDRYSGRWSGGGLSYSYRPRSTILVNSSSAGRSSVRVAGQSSFAAPLESLVTGYTSASRYTPSSSSSSSSHSSGGSFGGGFSGSGSSSRF